MCLMSCQLVEGYFMPGSLGITLVFYICCVVVSKESVLFGHCLMAYQPFIGYLIQNLFYIYNL